MIAFVSGDLSCGDEADDKPRQPATRADQALDRCEHYPLGVGREWTFWAGPLEIIERVSRHEKVGDELCARIETEFNGKVVSFEHVAVRSDGVYRVAVAGRPIEPPLRFLKLPARAGDTWKVDSLIAGEPIRGDFKTSEAALTIDDSEFSTIVVAGKDFHAGKSQLSFTYYFAPGIGKVKQVVVVNGMETTLELKTLPVGDEPAPRLSERQ
jgi:hypothetical protein